ncbi:hypothetical protein C8J57DRAFT_1436994 [Mycena rebaudengoi]|nr:hypothetical protein C8J57DRAFT_1436994 [Mycena rebaudengoi]
MGLHTVNIDFLRCKKKERTYEYIKQTHEKAEADKILTDIDRRSHEGEAVYLPAISGHVPVQMVRAVGDLIEFYHLVHRSVIDEDTLVAIDAVIFREVRPDGFSLPRQHSIVHYRSLIQGCARRLQSPSTSRRSKSPTVMLLINQRNYKLAAVRVYFTGRGMMDGALLPIPPPPTPAPPDPPEDPNDDHVDNGAIEGQLVSGKSSSPKPTFHEWVFMYNSACTVFYAPSDVGGIGGMHHEHIRAVQSWYHGPPRYDCVFIEHNLEAAGFRRLHAACVHLLFRFKFQGVDYPCALRFLTVVHLDCILRGAHLIGVAGKEFMPVQDFEFSDSLDGFNAFYVNKYTDHHAHEIAF